MKRRRPDERSANAERYIACKDVTTPRILRRVLAPPGHRQVIPAAVARARRGEHNRIGAVGKNVRLRRQFTGQSQTAFGHRLNVETGRRDLNFFNRIGRHGLAGRRLVQKQLARLNHWLAMKPIAHDAATQRIGDRDNRHALMMRHVVTDDRKAFALG